VAAKDDADTAGAKRRRLARWLLVLALASAVGMIVLTAVADGGAVSTTVNSIAGSRDGDGYEVSMSPVGTVRFASVPRRMVTLDAHYNDMLSAVGRQHDIVATGYSANFYDGFYRQLQSIDPSIDRAHVSYLYGQSGSGFDKETLYALNADVHHIDPMRLVRSSAWTSSDVAEIARNVGPFFANRYSRTWEYPGSEPYEFYTLWELCEKVGAVYRDADRIRELRAEYDRMMKTLRSRVPPEDARPSVGLVIYSQGRFLPFSLSKLGFGTAQYRAVGARDAFAANRDWTYADAGRGTWIDVEAMLVIDPDILIVPWAIYEPSRYEELKSLKTHPLGQRLTAVKADRLYPGGSPLQGPIFHLFQVEMAAKQIYPELFGRYRDDQRYLPEERLFSRDRVADIVGRQPLRKTK